MRSLKFIQIRRRDYLHLKLYELEGSYNLFEMKLLFLILYLLTGLQAFSQSNLDLKGKLVDCADKKPLILGSILLIKNGKTVDKAFIDLEGRFQFKDLLPGLYQLQTNYFYYPSKIFEINLSSDKEVNICISAENPDKLIQSFNSDQIFTLYYFGMPRYPDKVLNEVGRKYKVRWKNSGCSENSGLDKYNLMIKQILAYKNGKSWGKAFWYEVQKKDIHN